SLYAENSHAKEVLVLHSYHHALPRIDDIDKAIDSALKKDDLIIKTHTEYIDSKRIYDSTYIRPLYELYKYKFRNCKFDVIICSDNNALNFLFFKPRR
ncbi:MAG: PAS domain S-box protein, partial [Deltaproteobacteria bacterium]|nr:PAS domain S-box protein [Deltaproteobacteria bacterium]